MRHVCLPVALALLSQSAFAQDEASKQASAEISDEQIFPAAGFQYTDGAWRKCGDPGTVSYEPGQIARRGDFNGDGLTDAIVIEGGTYCFGMTGHGYTLISMTTTGKWRVMDERTGIPEFLDTTGTDGWPDIQVGGPGFCFPILRWNGTAYEVNRTEYEGQPCQP